MWKMICCSSDVFLAPIGRKCKDRRYEHSSPNQLLLSVLSNTQELLSFAHPFLSHFCAHLPFLILRLVLGLWLGLTEPNFRWLFLSAGHPTTVILTAVQI